MDDRPEFIDLFQQLDGMVNAFDAEGAGPLRKGEQPFHWATVQKLAAPLAERVPDLRVGIWLLRAGLACAGVAGLADGLRRIAEWMRLPPGELHPLAEAEEHPRELHIVSLAWLASPGFIASVREMPLWPEADVSVSRLLEASDPAHLLASDQVLEVCAHLESASLALRVIDNALLLEAPNAEFSLGALSDVLSRALTQINESRENESPEVTQPSDTVRIGRGAVSERGLSRSSSEGIDTRDDVRAALDRLITYFHEHEPGHPAPIFLQRIHRMLGASFEELLQELYPDAGQLVSRLERPVPH